MFYKKENLQLLITLCVLMLTFAGIAITQVCYYTPPQGRQIIYRNNLTPGWDTAGSWGSFSVNPLSTPTGQRGTNSLQMTFGGNWSGIELHKENVSTTGLDALVFRFRKEDASTELNSPPN